MALTKPPVLPAWAEAGDKVQPSNAEIQAGWPLSSIPPSRQRFNWLLNFLANGIRYFSRRGLPDYDAAETYMTGDRIIGDDGKTYRSLIDNNTAQTPSAQPTKWELWALTQAQSDLRVQNASAISSAAGGTADAITGSYTPAITALTNGMTLYVRAGSANATTTPTFTPNSGTLAAKTIVKGANSALAPGDIAGAGHWLDLQYDATLDKVVLLNPATGLVSATSASVQGSFKNLACSATGLDANVSISADEIALEDSANLYVTSRAVSLTVDMTSAGANGLDTGTVAASTWYSLWVIRKPNGTKAGLASLSTTSPTMPSGYTYKARVGWIRTDNTANKFPLGFVQNGRKIQYKMVAGSNLTTYPVIASGSTSSL